MRCQIQIQILKYFDFKGPPYIYEFLILQKSFLHTSQYQEALSKITMGKVVTFLLACSVVTFFYEFVTLQKAPLDTSQYQEALARWPGKSFSCLTVTRLVAQIPPAKTFQMPWILCTLYIVQYALFSCISCKQISGLPMQTDDAEG